MLPITLKTYSFLTTIGEAISGHPGKLRAGRVTSGF